MLAFALRRLAALLVTLVVASGVVFVALEVLPGDPAEVILGSQARADRLGAVRTKVGLERPAEER